MINWSQEALIHAKQLLNVQNPVEYYQNNIINSTINDMQMLLFEKPCNFVGNNIIRQCNYGKYRILHIGNYKFTVFLSSQMFQRSSSTAPAYRLGNIVSLDSCIISKLPGYFTNKSNDSDLANLVEHIIQSRMHICGFPYLIEDSFNRSGMKNKVKVYDCMLYYSLLRRLSNPNTDHSRDLQPSDYLDADDLHRIMITNRNHYNNDVILGKGIYCFLLKTYIIEFSSQKSHKPTSAEAKLNELVDFMNNELGFYFEYGTVLAYLYFTREHTIATSFFQKVKPNSKRRPILDIEGMAWDLFHVVHSPIEMAVHSSQLSCVALQSFATQDEALANVISFNPVVRVVFYKEHALAKFKYDICSFVTDADLTDKIKMNEHRREKVLSTVNWISLTQQLEDELHNLLGI